MPQKKRKHRRLGTSANSCDRRRAERQDDVWTWDFVFDRTASGSQLKWLSIVDEYTRECLALKVDRSITSEDVIDTLAELFAMRGVPKHIRSGSWAAELPNPYSHNDWYRFWGQVTVSFPDPGQAIAGLPIIASFATIGYTDSATCDATQSWFDS